MTITKGSTPSPSTSASAGGLSSQELQALSGIAASIGSSATAAATVGRVYMGPQKGPGNLSKQELAALPPSALDQIEHGASSAKWLTTDDATNEYFNWTQKKRDDFRAKGLLSGQLTQGAGDLEAFQLWSGLVKQAALYGAQDQQVGPMDILTGYVKSNSSAGWIKSGDFETNPLTGEKRYIGPASKTTTQTQVDLTDPATARAIAVKQFQDLMGRDPGQGEIEAYANALSQSEIQNPGMATTTTQYDSQGNAADSSTVTSGGMTADAQAQLAADQVKSKKEYGATQAATTYMNALTSAVGNG